MFKHVLLPTDGSNYRRPRFEREFSLPRASTPESPGFCVMPELRTSSLSTPTSPRQVKEQAHQQSNGRAKNLSCDRKGGQRSWRTVRNGLWKPAITPMKRSSSRRRKGMRSHHDGIPRPARRAGPAARQRNAESAHTLQDPRAGVPLNVGEARRSPGLRDPGRGIPATVKPGLLSGNAGVTLLPHRDS